jgi:hypothetical protein
MTDRGLVRLMVNRSNVVDKLRINEMNHPIKFLTLPEVIVL